MRIATVYKHSSEYDQPLPCSNKNVERLIAEALEDIGVTAKDVVNVQMDGHWGGGEWGIRVFCRKK